MTEKTVKARRRWRIKTRVWPLIGLITVAALIYWEQSAALYVLSTLAICLVLVLVAVADLEGKDKVLSQPVQEPSRAQDVSSASEGELVQFSGTRSRSSLKAAGKR